MGETSEAVLQGKERTWTMLVPEVQQEQAVTAGERGAGTGFRVAAGTEQEARKPATKSCTSSWFSFFKLGMLHILTGYDHLLFLFALLLRKQTFKQYAAIVTSFTLAHSITLSLSCTRLVHAAIAICGGDDRL